MLYDKICLVYKLHMYWAEWNAWPAARRMDITILKKLHNIRYIKNLVVYKHVIFSSRVTPKAK